MPRCPVDGCPRYFDSSDRCDQHVRREHSSNIFDYIEGDR